MGAEHLGQAMSGRAGRPRARTAARRRRSPPDAEQVGEPLLVLGEGGLAARQELADLRPCSRAGRRTRSQSDDVDALVRRRRRGRRRSRAGHAGGRRRTGAGARRAAAIAGAPARGRGRSAGASAPHRSPPPEPPAPAAQCSRAVEVLAGPLRLPLELLRRDVRQRQERADALARAAGACRATRRPASPACPVARMQSGARPSGM